MRFRGLKSSIWSCFAINLAIGMLLIGLVVVTLWYRDRMQAEILSCQKVLELFAHLHDEKSISKNITSRDILQLLCSGVGESCKDAFLIRGSETIRLHNEKQIRTGDLGKIQNISGHYLNTSSGDGWWNFLADKTIVVAFPVYNEGEKQGAIGVVLEISSFSHSHSQELNIILVYILVNTVILSAVGLFRLAKTVIKPLEKLASLSQKYYAKFNEDFFAERDGNELRQLSFALNRMFSRIESDKEKLKLTIASLEAAHQKLLATQGEMIRAEKLASVGRLSAGLAHEIGNPLGIVQGYVELLARDDVSEEDRLQFSQRAEKELTRIGGLIRQLLDFSKPVASADKYIHVYDILKNIFIMLQAQKDMEAIRISRKFAAKNDLVAINGEALHQVFLNCLLNSLDAIKEKSHAEHGQILVTCSEIRGDSGRLSILVSISDNGLGVDEKHRENVFDPFFTTKQPGKGTGLGLSVSHSIIDAAGGTMWLENNEQFGVSVFIELPLLVKKQLEIGHLH